MIYLYIYLSGLAPMLVRAGIMIEHMPLTEMSYGILRKDFDGVVGRIIYAFIWPITIWLVIGQILSAGYDARQLLLEETAKKESLAEQMADKVIASHGL